MTSLVWAARRIGLGLRPEDDPEASVEDWLEHQLTGTFTRLAIESAEVMSSRVVEWPAELTYDLPTRIERMTAMRRRELEIDVLGLDPIEYEREQRENRQKWSIRQADEFRFANAAIYSGDQVKQRLSWFWLNHFTVGGGLTELYGDYWETLYEHMDGTFADMLYRATTHPAMLHYLDNVANIGYASRKARECREADCVVGLNDNLARELLELHSVSPARGYTEDDIHNAAKVLAGWGDLFDQPWERPPQSWYEPWQPYHAEPGPKTVLGHDIPDGQAGLRVLTDMLAEDDFARGFVSRKLAHHFIGDGATDADVAVVESAWDESGGHLPTVHRAVLRQALVSPVKRFHWPLVWLFQVQRMSGSSLVRGFGDIGQNVMGVDRDGDHLMYEMGNSFWSDRQPNGYSDTRADWISTEHFDRRYRIASMTAAHGRPVLTAEQIVDRQGLSEQTRELVQQGRTPAQKFVLLACSPEMMEV